MKRVVVPDRRVWIDASVRGTVPPAPVTVTRAAAGSASTSNPSACSASVMASVSSAKRAPSMTDVPEASAAATRARLVRLLEPGTTTVASSGPERGSTASSAGKVGGSAATGATRAARATGGSRGRAGPGEGPRPRSTRARRAACRPRPSAASTVWSDRRFTPRSVASTATAATWPGSLRHRDAHLGDVVGGGHPAGQVAPRVLGRGEVGEQPGAVAGVDQGPEPRQLLDQVVERGQDGRAVRGADVGPDVGAAGGDPGHVAEAAGRQAQQRAGAPRSARWRGASARPR